MVEVAEYHPLAAAPAEAAAAANHSYYDPANLTMIDLVYAILLTVVVYGIALALMMPYVHCYDPKPRLFIRLVEVQGLDPYEAEERSPIFELAVDADWASSKRGPCAGGGDTMLRVSYRGIVLAWGSVPWFCIDGSRRVATVVAKAEGSVMREEMRNLIWAEQQAFGRVEFDVDGEIPGLDGHLYCKTYLFDEDTAGLPPCWIQKKPKQNSW